MGIKIMKNNISFNYTVSKGKFDAINVSVVINQTSMTDLDVTVKINGSTHNGNESVDVIIEGSQYKFAGELNGSIKMNGSVHFNGVDYKVDVENKFSFTEDEIKELYSPENISKIIDMIQAMSSVKEVLNSMESKCTPKTEKKSRHGNRKRAMTWDEITSMSDL